MDTYCDPEKQFRMIEIMMEFYERGTEVVEKGVPVDKIMEMETFERLSRMSNVPSDKWEERFGHIEMEMNEEFDSLLEEE